MLCVNSCCGPWLVTCDQLTVSSPAPRSLPNTTSAVTLGWLGANEWLIPLGCPFALTDAAVTIARIGPCTAFATGCAASNSAL
jgi:hypothetical protein